MPRRDRRGDIMKAAEKLSISRRFHEITLDDVVAEAGVGKGTIYRYFRDKDDLFFQTAMNGFDELCAMLGETLPGAQFPDRLLAACERINQYFSRRRAMLRMMQGQEWHCGKGGDNHHQQWHARRRELVRALGEVISQGLAEGAIRHDVAPEIQAAMLLGMLRARAREPELAQHPQSIQLTVDLFLRGAQSGAPAPQEPEETIA